MKGVIRKDGQRPRQQQAVREAGASPRSACCTQRIKEQDERQRQKQVEGPLDQRRLGVEDDPHLERQPEGTDSERDHAHGS